MYMCIYFYIYAFFVGVRLDLLLKHNVKCNSQVLATCVHHRPGSLCLSAWGFSSNFWKACSAYLHVQVDTPNLLTLLGMDSIEAWVILCPKDWDFIMGSFQCFKNILFLVLLLSGFQMLWERWWYWTLADCWDCSWTKQEHNDLWLMRTFSRL